MKQIKTKNLLLMLLQLAVSQVTFAQDIIVKKDGSTILSKVAEISPTEIKYKKWSNLNGPVYTVSVSELLSINYENGEKDTFDAPLPAQTSASQSQQQAKTLDPDTRNAEIIQLYNQDYHLTKAIQKKFKPEKEAHTGVLFFKVDETSIMSNEELEMTFVPCTTPHPGTTYKEYSPQMRYNILLKNKTDKIVYVDLASCVRTSNLGEHRVYYTSEEVGVGTSSGGGVSVGLGAVAGALGVGGVVGTIANGVGVNQGSSATINKSYTQMRVLNIPPRTTAYLTNFKYMEVKGDRGFSFGKYVMGEKGEEFCFCDFLGVFRKYFVLECQELNIPTGIVNQGGEAEFTKENSPLIYDYVITYSTNSDFSTYSTLNSTLYVGKVIGLQINYTSTAGQTNRTPCIDMWDMWGTNKGMEKYIENYNQNTICGPVQFKK